jgi:branched-chain amino acid aminotransferase
LLIKLNKDMKKNKCYLNGKIIDKDSLVIDPYDIGLLRGYGVFDVMCTQNGKPFMLLDHWKRLENSAREIGLRIPITKKEYQMVVVKLLKINAYKKANIRTVLTGGLSPNGFAYRPGKETFFVLIEKFTPLAKDVFEKGAGVVTVEYARQFCAAKVTNYVAAIKNQKRKEKAGALEIIYLENGKALEASTSNFFIVKNGKIITTKDGILLGITRKLVISLAKKVGLKVEERNILEKELFSADEIFLTATNKDIVPVVKIDGKKVGRGLVGKKTKLLMGEFKKFTERY